MDNARAFFNLEGKGTQVRSLVGAGEEQSGILPEVSALQQLGRWHGTDAQYYTRFHHLWHCLPCSLLVLSCHTDHLNAS